MSGDESEPDQRHPLDENLKKMNTNKREEGEASSDDSTEEEEGGAASGSSLLCCLVAMLSLAQQRNSPKAQLLPICQGSLSTTTALGQQNWLIC
jgi:hypothetical protein